MFGSVIFFQLNLSRAKGLHQTNAAGPGDQTLHPGFHEKFFPPVAGLRKVHQKSTNNDLGVRSD